MITTLTHSIKVGILLSCVFVLFSCGDNETCEPSENEFYFLSSKCWSVPTKHTSRVSSVGVSDDSSLVVSSSKGEVFLWEIRERALSFVKRIAYVAYEEDEMDFATFDRLAPSVPAYHLPRGEIDFLAIDPNNRYVFIYEFDFNRHTATLFDTKTDEIVWVLDNSKSDRTFITEDVNDSAVDHTFNHASFSFDGEFVALTYFGRIEIVRTKDGSLAQTIPTTNEHFNFATFSPRNRSLFVLTNNNTAFLWDIDTERKKQGYILLGNGKYADFDNEGKKIVISLDDKPLQIIDLATHALSTTSIASGADFVQFGGGEEREFVLPFSKYSPDIKIYRHDAQLMSKVFKHQNNAITSVALSPNGAFVFAGDESGTLKLWDMNSNGIYDKAPPKPLNPSLKASETGFVIEWETNDIDNENIQYFHFSYQEEGANEWSTKKIAYDTSRSKKTQINTKNLTKYFFRIRTEGYNGKFSEYATFEGDSMLRIAYVDERVYSLVFQDDFFLVGNSGNDLNFFQIANKEVIRMDGFEYDSPFLSVDLHPSLPQVIAGSMDGHIVVLDIDKTQGLTQTHLINARLGSIPVIKYSHDGKLFAFASANNEIKLGDPLTGKILPLQGGYSSETTSVVFSKNNDKIIASSKDGLLKAWSTTSFENNFSTYTASVITDMDISNDDVLYTIHSHFSTPAPTLSTSLSCAISMWNINGDPIGRYTNGLPRDCTLNSIDVSQDGRYILAVANANTPLILDTHKKSVIDMQLNMVLPTLSGDENTSINSMKFSQDENHILVQTADKESFFVLMTDNYIK